MVDMVPIRSSALAAVGYDPEDQILTIQFRKRGTYTYEGVPADVYEHLVAEQDSAGQFFNHEIKPYYRSKQAVLASNTAEKVGKAVLKAAVAAITKKVP